MDAGANKRYLVYSAALRNAGVFDGRHGHPTAAEIFHAVNRAIRAFQGPQFTNMIGVTWCGPSRAAGCLGSGFSAKVKCSGKPRQLCSVARLGFIDIGVTESHNELIL